MTRLGRAVRMWIAAVWRAGSLAAAKGRSARPRKRPERPHHADRRMMRQPDRNLDRKAEPDRRTGETLGPAHPAGRLRIAGSVRITIARCKRVRIYAGPLVVRQRGGCGVLLPPVQTTGFAK